MVGVLLLGLVGLVGLVAIKAAAAAVAEESLNQYAQADNWDVSIDLLTAPKLMLGKPADIDVAGQQVTVDKASGQKVERVSCSLQGVVFDRAAQKVSQLANGSFEMALTSAQLDAVMASKLGADEGKITTAFEGANLKINGDMPLPQGLGNLKLTATTTPEVVPPSSLRLRVDDLKLEPPAGLNLPGFDIGKISATMKTAMSKEMTTELFKPASGITLQSVSIVGQEMVFKGTISAQALAGGQ